MNSSKQKNKNKAVVLFSGGLDSTTCLAIAVSKKFEVHALTFHYGQRHHAEISAAKINARNFSTTSHDFFDIDLSQFGGSALTSDKVVPKNRSKSEMDVGIPITYVPARNTVFLAIALARAETIGANDIFIGVNALDYSGYPDCRPEYIEAFQALANLATKASVEALEGGTKGIRIHAPLQDLTKSEIIRKGISLGVEYGFTMSCYDPMRSPKIGEFVHCGHCDACLLRKTGFKNAGISDPTKYYSL